MCQTSPSGTACHLPNRGRHALLGRIVQDASKRAAKASAVNCVVLPYFLKQLLFFAFSDMLIVVWDLSVGAILPCVILDKSLVKKFMVQFTQVAFNIGYVVRRSGFIHVIREEIPVVMLNAAVV